MDIQKSQRLSQYLGVISGMVKYSEIGMHMVERGTLSLEEHQLLETKLVTDQNTDVMNEFLTMVNLRRGGFDAFLQVLRMTDYMWVAEQLDPGKCFTGPSSSTTGGGRRRRKSVKMQNLISNVRQTINRKSEPVMKMNGEEEFTFMSYRGSCPIDIPINPRHYMEDNLKRDIVNTPEQMEEPKEAFFETNKNEVASQLMNLDLEVDSNEQKSNNNIALVENIPGSLIQDSTAEYFTKLAKRLEIPTDLKVIRYRKIAKNKRRGKISNVKLQFQSENVRNHFVTNFKEFIMNLKPTDELYNTATQLNVSVPKAKLKTSPPGIFKNKNKSISKRERDKSSFPCPDTTSNATNMLPSNHIPIELETSKKHWYQHRFSLKSWRKKKD